jgi:hypothetical protein
MYRLEPWGEERADLRSGIVASVIANVHRNPKKQRKPCQPVDFMPDFAGERKRKKDDTVLTPEQSVAAVEMLLASGWGGKVTEGSSGRA